MGFSSEIFIFIFLPASIVLYSCFSRLKNIKWHNFILILLNLAFYAWSDIDSLAVFLILALIGYGLGTLLYHTFLHQEPWKITVWSIFSVLILLLPLFLSKYASILFEKSSVSTCSLFSLRKFLAPLGISFVTFECISYFLDIKNGLATPGSFFDFLLFLSFFPKLISGPIVLWRDFQSQIHTTRNCQFAMGIEKIIIGYAEKAILADSFGAQIQLIAAQSAVDTPTLWLKAFLYFFQIYFDFSGYSQIAIGLCNIFGFEMKDNFDYPYISKSVSEFWRRWHISLGSWFRNYIYFPLGGSRKGNTYINIFVVFLITGIWHGANWTFVIWGCLHGFAVVLEHAVSSKKWYQKIPNACKWILTMSYVYFTWILFSSSDIASAFRTIQGMFTFVSESKKIDFTWKYFLTKKIVLLLSAGAIGSFLGFFDFSKLKNRCAASNLGTALYDTALLLLFVLDILFIVNSSYSPFLYFQF